MNKWYRLDNAGKIFPSVSNARRSNLFRLSVNLTEEVNPTVLQEALNTTIKRFVTFNVKLKRGLFWYYLEENKETPLVVLEDPFLLEPLNHREEKGFLFRVSYYHKRISLEVFHALSDGYGGMQFLKSVTYNYLLLMGKDVKSENMILTDMETIREEDQDSFLKNYDSSIKIDRKEQKARHFSGTFYENNWISLITGKIDESEIKNVCNKYDCSYTQFIASCVIMSVFKCKNILDKKRAPFQIFVPVNLRRFFPSITLRNFSLYVRTKFDIDKELTFEEVVGKVKSDLLDELQKDKLHARIVANVKWERLFFMRIIPLFFKQIGFKIGYNMLGESANSFSLSNLGKVEIPSSMKKYIDEIVFSNGAGYTAPMNMGVVVYKGKVFLTFTSKIIERDLQREFFRLLSSLGLNVIIETNELEV
ncbi:MAG: hypothetical protein PHO86_05145 [Bacilli bacterium]|nr:hypothetical protein [Bacilli bacterium]